MTRSIHGLIFSALLVSVASSGCQSIGTATVRGQSPSMTSGAEVVTPTGHYRTPIRSTASEVADIYHEHHNTTTYYPGSATQAGHHQAYACPNGNCPPAAGYECPPGQAYYGPHGGCRTGLCQDRLSYGYQVPNDLVYPDANAVGGAVVYPYYTHRGPSDFFRK